MGWDTMKAPTMFLSPFQFSPFFKSQLSPFRLPSKFPNLSPFRLPSKQPAGRSFGWAGFAPAGRLFQNFQGGIVYLLFQSDQHCLVASAGGNPGNTSCNVNNIRWIPTFVGMTGVAGRWLQSNLAQQLSLSRHPRTQR